MISLNEIQKKLSKKYNNCCENPKISVIVPVYNTEEYILDCLLSLVNQSLEEIEIIAVDDNSTDNTLSIVNEFAKFDKRIKIITQENQGVGAARNNALKEAQGEYIAYVDGDDKLNEQAFEKLYSKLEEIKSDIIVFGAKNLCENKIYKSGYGIEKISSKLKEKILDKKSISENIFKIPSPAWCKLYKTSLIKNNNILFQNGCIGEDQIFFIKSMLYANSCYIINENYYYYRRKRKNSLTYGKLKTNNSPILNFQAVEEFLSSYEISSKLQYKILNKYFIKAISWLGKCDNSYKKTYYNQLVEFCKNICFKYSKYYWKYIKINENSSYLGLKIEICKNKLIHKGECNV